jgi:hypothetical protein
VNRIVHVLIGDLPTVGDVAIKTAALILTAAILFRFTERRTLAEFAPFDWIAAVAAGAIVGRAATATDTGWLQATTALLCLLAAHAVLARLRLIPRLVPVHRPAVDGADERRRSEPTQPAPLRPGGRGFRGGAARTRAPQRRLYSSGHSRSQRGHLRSGR